ncbi:unnamed protein product, partial [Discosporangium mesarthrocarpum]
RSLGAGDEVNRVTYCWGMDVEVGLTKAQLVVRLRKADEDGSLPEPGSHEACVRTMSFKLSQLLPGQHRASQSDPRVPDNLSESLLQGSGGGGPGAAQERFAGGEAG